MCAATKVITEDKFLTVKSWTSSVVTLRRLRELHPVSRHVFPFRSEYGGALSLFFLLFVFLKYYGVGVSGNFERLPCGRSGVGGTCTDAKHVGVFFLLLLLLLLRASVCPSAVPVCQPAGFLRAGQPARFAITCPPAST